MATRRSPLGLLVLAMLSEEPMHAYGMQRLIEQRGKDRVVNVRRRGSLYQTIERLRRLGLVEVRETVSTPSYPDRIVYQITDEGHETAREWLRETLRTSGSDFPDFPAGISVLTLLSPEDAESQLKARADAVSAELSDVEATIVQAGELPRLFLLEEEYRRAVLTAQLAWLGEVVHDLRTGQLSWDDAWLRATAEQFAPERSTDDDDS